MLTLILQGSAITRWNEGEAMWVGKIDLRTLSAAEATDEEG